MKLIIAIANKNNWPLFQVDFKSAYLNSEIPPGINIYMEQPPGYIVPGKEDHVCRLKRYIYGLKQVGREWHQTLLDFLIEIDFTRSEFDHAVFYRN